MQTVFWIVFAVAVWLKDTRAQFGVTEHFDELVGEEKFNPTSP